MSGVGDSTDALVPSGRWQESENSMRGVGGVIHSAGGFVSAAQASIVYTLMIFSAVLTILLQGPVD